MAAFFADLLNIATVVFAVSSMLSVGLTYTIHEIVEPLRNARLLIGALVANFVLVPLLAYLLTQIFSIGAGREVGLLVVASAAGAPFLVKLAQMAHANVAIASGLLVLLLLVTMAYMPLVVPLIAPGARVNAASVAQPLVLTMLLPLVIGHVADRVLGGWLDRLLPPLGQLTNVALVLLVVSTLITNLRRIVGVFGTGALLVAFLFIVGAFAIGYVLGMTGRGTREELALATAQRNIAAATVVATQAIDNADALVMVIIVSIAAMAILFPTARALRSQVVARATSEGRGDGRRKAPG